MTEAWTKDFELGFWTDPKREGSHREDALSKLRLKFGRFFVPQPMTAVDVGGGRYGGALRFVSAQDRILVDALGKEFEEMGDLPEGVQVVTADFSQIPLESASVDALFCWETLDHALSMDHFIAGQKELIRLLRPRGRLYFQHVARERPTDGHTLIISADAVLEELQALALADLATIPYFDNGIEIFATLEKL